MLTNPSARLRALLAACALPAPAFAQIRPDILVTAKAQADSIENAPATSATVTAEQIADTVNAINVEDTLKYLPSLVVRKRHIGDTQAPLATRTSGLGSSARSLIYADGALLSALIGNNNTAASPRWGLVSPEEIARVDVLYGPYSAAYAGNSIGAVVNITTRLPDRLEGTLTAATSVQRFGQYDTRGTFPAYQLAATLGDRFGPLALFGSVTRTWSRSHPLTYVTALRTAAPAANGGVDALNRTAQAIRVLGASGLEHQVQDNAKLKAALDLSSTVRLTYVGGLFVNDTDAAAQTYLTDRGTGLPFYTGAFNSGVYRYDERHWSHALSATGTGRIDWQVIGTVYDWAHDVQRTPTGALPAGFAGGAGNITRLDGTGWETLDAKAAWATGRNTLSAGAHVDRFEVNSNRYATTDWLTGRQGALNQASRGRTRTAALWAQDELRIAAPLTLTLGARYEWWRAFDGFNFSAAPALSVNQPSRTARGFSPKASLAWTPTPGWTARLSAGKAYRFPTVGELYQAVTTGTVLTVPDPTLRPERAWSQELAVEHAGLRVSLFNEAVRDALISQAATLVPGSSATFTYVQNVPRTRARGVEAAFNRTVDRFDLSASVTYADAETRANPAFPASVGKRLPSVPRWKATAVATWRPDDRVALTAAARYATRNYATLDNSDTVGNTYQGFYKYLVVDLRANVRVGDHYALGLGVDNVANDRYFLFHPFPQRTVHADITARL